LKDNLKDKHGNEITDPILIQDIQRGVNVISYNEQKVEDKQEKRSSSDYHNRSLSFKIL
jgi:hypothetical protein